MFEDDEAIDLETVESLKRKRAEGLDLDALWSQVIEPMDTAFTAYRDETIDKWNDKVQQPSKKFKVINTSITAQIRASVSDTDRLLKRTQLMRSQYNIIGAPLAKPDVTEADKAKDAHLKKYHEEVFDDCDYYQHLLKELIESRITSDDPTQLAIKFAQLKALNKKQKKVVDTRASKGRKIRYVVHEKIQNFMASEPKGTWHDEMVEELFAGLIGKSAEVEEEAAQEVRIDDGFKIL
jgi:protein AATF/BFR2